MKHPIQLSVSEDDEDVAYLFLPDHPGSGVQKAVARNVRLSSLVDYAGPDIYLDIDKDGRLVGLEILA
jgi:uncharacterized protein YuzE